MIKVSIIVPVYNVEKYLCQCIDSLLNQTLEEIEVICVDDGSTDKSGQILDDYQAKDARVMVIHKENRGYGHTINVGLNNAKGEYVGIVESDDYVLPEMFETLYLHAEKDQLDFVKSDFFLFWKSENNKLRINVCNDKKYYNKVLTEEMRDIFFSFWMMNWTGIYRRAFLNQNEILHNETPGASYQDNGFWIQVMSLARRTMWISEAFYMYRQDNPLSSMKSQGKMLATMNEYDFALSKLDGRISVETLSIINLYRLRECRVTFMRIDDSLKKMYLEYVLKEYDKNKLLLSRLKYKEDDIFVWLNNIKKDPLGYCHNYVECKKRVYNLLKNNEIILYGAGHYANLCFGRLFALGLWDSVKFVAVSSKELVASTQFFEKPIVELSEIKDSYGNACFVLAGSETATFEMKENLKYFCSPKIVLAKELMDLFYAI